MIEVRLKITVFYGAILTEVIKNKNENLTVLRIPPILRRELVRQSLVY